MAISDFSVVLPVKSLPALERATIGLVATLEADGTPAQAQVVRAAYVRLLDELKTIARTTAAEAQKFIVEEEVKSRVRPDTGGDGGPRMEDFLGVSQPLDAVEGSVGINDESVLNADVPWWWTNEEGYSGHVGRVVHGFFYEQGFTGRAHPDPGQSREHPLFRAEGPQSGRRQGGKLSPVKQPKGTRPGMLIQNPIPERRFVRRGAGRAEAAWHARVDKARARFLREVERANLESKAIVARRVAAGPRPRGRRRP